MVDCTSLYCGRSMNSSLVLSFNQNLPISQNPVLGFSKTAGFPNNHLLNCRYVPPVKCPKCFGKLKTMRFPDNFWDFTSFYISDY